MIHIYLSSCELECGLIPLTYTRPIDVANTYRFNFDSGRGEIESRCPVLLLINPLNPVLLHCPLPSALLELAGGSWQQGTPRNAQN